MTILHHLRAKAQARVFHGRRATQKDVGAIAGVVDFGGWAVRHNKSLIESTRYQEPLKNMRKTEQITATIEQESNRYVALLIASVILCSFMYAYNTDSAEKVSKKTEYTLTGGALKACIAAFAHFSKIIEYHSKSSSELDVFFSKPENFNIQVTYDQENYTVYFGPKEFKGGGIKGGGARYIVNGGNYKIVDTLFYK